MCRKTRKVIELLALSVILLTLKTLVYAENAEQYYLRTGQAIVVKDGEFSLVESTEESSPAQAASQERSVKQDAKEFVLSGAVKGTQGKFVEAILDFNKAIAIDPGFADAYAHRATAYYGLEEFDNAWADVQKVKELGYAVSPVLIAELKKATGRDK